MAIKQFYKIITPLSAPTAVGNNQDIGGSNGLYGNYTWYHRLLAGSAHRINRYKEYDVMDNDIDVARALDIISEEMMGNNPKTKMPLDLEITTSGEQYVASTAIVTIKAALKTWCNIQDWHTRLFPVARHVIKYGDCFFMRPKKAGGKYMFVHPKNVIEAIVSSDDITDVRGWRIKTDVKEVGNAGNNGTGGNFLGMGNNSSAMSHGVEDVDKKKVVRFTLNSDMTEEAPFGESILRSIFRTFKQKELIEDALIIYRVQRAPERRVFYIDVGKMPAQMVGKHLEGIKNEIKQKKVPSQYGGKSQVDSTYNPQSMSEDFFFAQRSDGSGSRVEVLPGGQNLGELQDLEYFYKKIWRGLRIPQSYMDTSTEGGAVDNDGKVGIAYMQEIKFALYIERLQKALESTLDAEFKQFLHDSKINVDTSVFRIVLPAPSNYAKSREQSIDGDLLANFSQADGFDSLSKRFALKKYLQLTEEEIKINERMKREEMGLNPDGDDRDLPQIYNIAAAEAGGFEGGLGGSSGGLPGDGLDDEGSEDGMDDEEGGEGADEGKDDFVDAINAGASGKGAKK